MATKATEPPTIYVVLESFIAVENGAPVPYLKGEPVEPDDPYLKTMPERFGPLVYPHPVKRRPRMALATPEVRS